MTTTATRPSTAETILSQLGGSARLSIMLGATNFVSTRPSTGGAYGDHRGGLSFAIGQNPKAVRYVLVSLSTDDTYTVNFLGRTGKEKGFNRGVYVANLARVIEEQTGLVLSLGTCGGQG